MLFYLQAPSIVVGPLVVVIAGGLLSFRRVGVGGVVGIVVIRRTVRVRCGGLAGIGRAVVLGDLGSILAAVGVSEGNLIVNAGAKSETEDGNQSKCHKLFHSCFSIRYFIFTIK